MLYENNFINVAATQYEEIECEQKEWVETKWNLLNYK